MAGVDYDGIQGLLRVLAAGEKPEPFAIEVLAFHAAVEYEIEVVLRKLLNRPDVLLTGSPKLGFGQKVKVLLALWPTDDDAVRKFGEVLKSFQQLRDAVAHMDQREVAACRENLMTAYRIMIDGEKEDYSLAEVAQSICLYMSNGTTIEGLSALFDYADKLVNKDFLGAFSRPPRTAEP